MVLLTPFASGTGDVSEAIPFCGGLSIESEGGSFSFFSFFSFFFFGSGVRTCFSDDFGSPGASELVTPSPFEIFSFSFSSSRAFNFFSFFFLFLI